MPGTDDLMAGYSNSIGGLMADHNSMVSGLMANYNAGGGSGGGIMAGPAFTPGPGVSYGPGPMNNTGRWTPNGMPGSSWDNPFAGTPWEGMLQPPMQPMGQEFEQGGDAPPQPPRRKIRGYSNPAARSTKVPFGGAFANGGIAPAGKVSLVGERGPELIMPTGPTKVVPMPSMRLIEAQKQNAIAGQNQRDLDAKFGAQPQAMRSIDAAFTDNSLSGRASARDGAVRTGSLSERGATPVGSGRMTPERRMQMLSRRAWTRGDDSAVANLTQAGFGMEQRGIDRAFQAGQQGEQRDFMRERDATNHAQGMQMWNLDRSFQLDAEGRRNQAALDAEGRRNQRGDAEWTRSRDAELEDRKNSAIDAPFTMTDPSGKFVIPGVRTKGGDFKAMGGAYPVHTPTTPPNPGEIAKHISDNMAKGIIADWDGKSFRYSPMKPDKPGDQGSESTVYDDAGGIIQRTVRTPRGGSAGSKGTGYW